MLTKRQLAVTYVVIEDTTTRWGFMGFDTDPTILFVGTRKACADWVVESSMSMKQPLRRGTNA